MSDERRPRVSVQTPTYGGVSVDHPSIKAAIQTMAKQGRKVEEISRIVGMPGEVIRRHAPDVKSS